MAQKLFLILRRLRSGRLEGRTAPSRPKAASYSAKVFCEASAMARICASSSQPMTTKP
jgi:hypothetical protein